MSYDLAKLALRAQALAVVVCTTGSITLEATTTGYARASGSFVTDGFRAGMELAPSGFTQTALGVITHVDALTLTIQGGRTVQSAGAGRSLSVATPAIRRFGTMAPMENGVAISDLVQGRPYWREMFAPSTQRLLTTSAHGVVVHTGLYRLTWAGLPQFDESGILRCVGAVLSAFPPARKWALANGEDLEVRGDVAPWASEVTAIGGSWAASTITIPWQITARLP